MPKKSKFRFTHVHGLFLVTLILSLLGLLFVFDASVAESFTTFGDQYHFLRQQALWFGVGLAGMIVASFIPTKFWQKTAHFWYGAAILMLLLIFVPTLGRELNGARRWLDLGYFWFQPIEFVKFALVIFLSSWLHKHQRLLPFLFYSLLPALLVLLQPDLGSTLVLLSIAFVMYFVAGGQIKWLLAMGGVGVALISLLVLSSNYRWQRVQTFFSPSEDPLGAGFHIRQITLALGRGGWLGQGIGNSKQKFSYVPEASTDSIFAIIAEEIGFVGSLVIIILFALYFWLIMRNITQAKADTNQRLLGLGFMTWIASQTLLNLGAVVAFIPLTGIPLPFVSYGGSALVTALFATGVVMRIGKEQLR